MCRIYKVYQKIEGNGLMKSDYRKHGKVLKFTQTESSLKRFRPDHPVADDMKKYLLGNVFTDFTSCVIQKYYSDYLVDFEEFIDSHNPRPEKRQSLELNLFWWQLLYHANLNGASAIEEYITNNDASLKEKSFVTSWLREWDKAIPKFYHIGYMYNDRVLVVTDILTHETIDVIVYAPGAIPPRKGEIVMGTLLPIGDALYFPINDFYHFDYEPRAEIVAQIHHHFESHLQTSTIYEAFLHVLSVVLQVEELYSSDVN